jgi:hypothetical protein
MRAPTRERERERERGRGIQAAAQPARCNPHAAIDQCWECDARRARVSVRAMCVVVAGVGVLTGALCVRSWCGPALGMRAVQTRARLLPALKVVACMRPGPRPGLGVRPLVGVRGWVVALDQLQLPEVVQHVRHHRRLRSAAQVWDGAPRSAVAARPLQRRSNWTPAVTSRRVQLLVAAGARPHRRGRGPVGSLQVWAVVHSC